MKKLKTLATESFGLPLVGLPLASGTLQEKTLPHAR